MPPVTDWQFLLHAQPRHVTAASSYWAGDLSAEITAIATVALVVLALAAAIVAGIALRKQSRELAILTKQNNRDIAERRRAQAARVYIVVEDHRPRYTHPYAVNGSDFPVYDAQFWQADPGGLSDPYDVGMIPPHLPGTDKRDLHYHDAVGNTVLTFRDAAGVCWIRMPDGTLREQEHNIAADSILAALGRPAATPLG